jgi:hypothetical protein
MIVMCIMCVKCLQLFAGKGNSTNKEMNNSRSPTLGTEFFDLLESSLMEDMRVDGFDLSSFDNCNPIMDLGKCI